jgi:hypothetical protein
LLRVTTRPVGHKQQRAGLPAGIEAAAPSRAASHHNQTTAMNQKPHPISYRKLDANDNSPTRLWRIQRQDLLVRTEPPHAQVLARGLAVVSRTRVIKRHVTKPP